MLDMTISPMIVVGLCFFIVLVVVISFLYSPGQYKRLKEMYRAQVDADNTVYDHLKHCNIAEKLLFRWTTKDVEHYYE